jgi:hypothetical protein
MKGIVKKGVAFVSGYLVLYALAWVAASAGLFKDVEFGYYGEFNVAKHAIQKTGCAEKVEYNFVNTDVVLEEFHFRVTTKSGRVVGLFFDASNMDVSQVCYAPVGISVLHPAYEGDRRYSPDLLSEHLKEKGIQIKDLKDILCNIDLLEEVFRLTQGDEKARRETDDYVWDYIRVRFLTEEELKRYEYTDVRDKDITDWRP